MRFAIYYSAEHYNYDPVDWKNDPDITNIITYFKDKYPQHNLSIEVFDEYNTDKMFTFLSGDANVIVTHCALGHEWISNLPQGSLLSRIPYDVINDNVNKSVGVSGCYSGENLKNSKENLPCIEQVKGTYKKDGSANVFQKAVEYLESKLSD